MIDAEKVAELQRRVDGLQTQIVELRLAMDQKSEAIAALIDHAVSRAVDAKTGGRILTEDNVRWIRDGTDAAAERKKARSAIIVHVMQWVVGLTISFVLWSVWDSVRAKIGLPPKGNQ